jgi:dipeptidase E
MRLYLSSFRMGDHPERMLELLEPGPAAVIANAMDTAPTEVRNAAVERELDALAELGLDPEEVDLRRHHRSILERYALLWVRGGNVFVLRKVLAASGADATIRRLLAGDAAVYAGYSAGPCVLGPSLRGFELVDDVGAVDGAPLWDGLGVLDFVFVPHVDSPDHPESEGCGRLAARLAERGVSHRTFRDGEALVVDGDRTEVC